MSTMLLFSASWCAPCQRAKPLVRQFCDAKGIELRVVDVDAEPELATKHSVIGVPTIVYGARRWSGGVPTLGKLKELVEE